MAKHLPFSAPQRRSLPTINTSNPAEVLQNWKTKLTPIVKRSLPSPTPKNFAVTNARGGLKLTWAPVQTPSDKALGSPDGYEILKSASGSFTDDLVIIPIRGANATEYFDSLGGSAQTASYRIRTTSGTSNNPQSHRGPESGVISHTSLDAADTTSVATTVQDTFSNDKTRSLARLGNYGAFQNSNGGIGTTAAATGAVSTAATAGGGAGNSSAGAASILFSAIGSGTNNSAQMVVGLNASLTPDPNNPGIISSTHIQGNLVSTAIPADGNILAYSATDGQYDLPTNIFLNPSGSGNILPASGNTTQSLGSVGAPWNAGLYNATFKGGRPWYDVRAFGAAGNGTTDDTAAVQAAIDAACTAGGGVVFFPQGTYKTTSVLAAPSSGKDASNVHLTGTHGSTLVIVPDTGSNIYGLQVGSAFGVGRPITARPITGTIAVGATSFTATNAGDTSDLVAGDWIVIYIVDSSSRNGTVAVDFQQVASVSGGTTVNLMQPVEIAFAAGTNQALKFARLAATGPVVENFELSDLTLVMDATSEGTTQASLFSPYYTHNLYIHDCTFVVSPPTAVAGNWLSLNGCWDVVIQNNRFISKGSTGGSSLIELAFSKNVVCTGNTFETESTANAFVSVQLDFALRRFQFTKNHINGSASYGILAYAGVQDGIISQNTVGLISSCISGIEVLGGHHVQVANNILLGPTATGTSRGINVTDDTLGTATITSTGMVVSQNAIGTQKAFATEAAVANAGDLFLDTTNAGTLAIGDSVTPGLVAAFGRPLMLIGTNATMNITRISSSMALGSPAFELAHATSVSATPDYYWDFFGSLTAGVEAMNIRRRTPEFSGIGSDAVIATFDQNGLLNLPVSGSAIKFGGTTQLSNAGLNFGGTTLSRYDEGTYTPTASNLTTAGTVTVSGKYIRIGKLVWVGISVTVATGGGSSATFTSGATAFTLPSTPAVNSAGTGSDGNALNGVVWVRSGTSQVFAMFSGTNNGTAGANVVTLSAVYTE